jgi:hemolysin D
VTRRRDSDFLPAALAVEETPASPAGRAVLWTVMALFVLGVAWSILGRVDIVAVAHGRIIPSGHSKPVQSLDRGTVAALYVREGQRVARGELLIELESDAARADVERLGNELADARRDVDRFTRLSAWAAGASGGEGPRQAAPSVDGLIRGQWQAFRARIQVLERESARHTQAREGAVRQTEKLAALLPILERRAANHKRLADDKLLPEQQYLETEQARLEVLHDLRAQRSRVAELAAALDESASRRRQVESEFRRDLLERLEEARRRAAALAQELRKARVRVEDLRIVAPVDGVVQQLGVHHVGAVVTPAQPLMVVVPLGERLEVEAVLENKDIGFVEAGQPVVVKVDTFPFTRYGAIDGQVTDLSRDAVDDERRGLVYKLRARMDRSSLQVEGRTLSLSPGMSVTVEAKTGQRRLIDYFLSPLLRYADESVRER